jgi:hypothetical protein
LVVDWEIDPRAEPLGADSTRVVVLATERECASGRAMGDRLEEPVVTFTEDAVVVELTASRLDGFPNCQGTPSQRVEIELAEPLGERNVKDARATDLGDSP